MPMRLIYFILVLIAANVSKAQLNFIKIPKQDVAYRLHAGNYNINSAKIQKFKISRQVTFREYKEYLSEVKRDSTVFFYQKQLPSIVGQKQLTDSYNLTNEFDDLPVIGVSFESACNYAKWYQEKYGKNGKGYRLPSVMEWLSMYQLNRDKLKDTTISKSLLSDWTINAYDESMYELSSNKLIDFFYDYNFSEPAVFKRKCIIGHSFRYSVSDPMEMIWHPYFANEGYAEVGFRILEATEDDKLMKYSKTYSYEK